MGHLRSLFVALAASLSLAGCAVEPGAGDDEAASSGESAYAKWEVKPWLVCLASEAAQCRGAAPGGELLTIGSGFVAVAIVGGSIPDNQRPVVDPRPLLEIGQEIAPYPNGLLKLPVDVITQVTASGKAGRAVDALSDKLATLQLMAREIGGASRREVVQDATVARTSTLDGADYVIFDGKAPITKDTRDCPYGSGSVSTMEGHFYAAYENHRLSRFTPPDMRRVRSFCQTSNLWAEAPSFRAVEAGELECRSQLAVQGQKGCGRCGGNRNLFTVVLPITRGGALSDCGEIAPR